MSGRDTISDNDHSTQATASVAIPPATGAAAGNRASLVFQRLHASSVLPATASLISPVRPAIQSPDVLPENASSRRHPEQRSLHRSKTAGGSVASSIWSHVRATTPGESAAPRTNSSQSPRSMPSAWPSGLRRASTYSMVTSSNAGESGAFGAVTAPETPTIPSMGPLGEVSDGTGDEGSVYEGAGTVSAETSPLLPPASSAETAQQAVFKRSIKPRIASALGGTMSGLTPEQVNVAKAVLAYSLAALVPFVPFLRDWLGDPDYMSPHLVTNATIWYHAAKTRSGLTEGGLVGIIWVFVTSCVMYVALFTGEWLHERYAVDPSAISLLGNSDDVP
ncbi:hypothetical protein DL89DRAFT_16687 [Linderina pennispora]|uniref:Uncharacterized protein n=1 Tax=Linderina pennispora TaxID=61395 RepID=A0A1Y1WLK2_9FUNG|nr:uncharacterized protein DL89DRAFT_16687 [Linderina pennispora]ORX74451.1 hypothetical protein DL89DRAFT_16687 [Linderina pennispora]